MNVKGRCPFCRHIIGRHLRLCYDGSFSVCVTIKGRKAIDEKLNSKAHKDWQWAHGQAAKVGAPH